MLILFNFDLFLNLGFITFLVAPNPDLPTFKMKISVLYRYSCNYKYSVPSLLRGSSFAVSVHCGVFFKKIFFCLTAHHIADCLRIITPFSFTLLTVSHVS